MQQGLSFQAVNEKKWFEGNATNLNVSNSPHSG